MKTVKYKQM